MFKWSDGNWVPHIVRKEVPVVRAGMRKCTLALVWQVIARVVQKTTRSKAEMTTNWYIRDRHTKFCKVVRCQTVQTLVYCRAQFEDDALWDAQRVQFIVKDVCQTPIKLLSSSNDSGSRYVIILTSMFTNTRLCCNIWLWTDPSTFYYY